MENKLFRKNEFKVVGRLKDVDAKLGRQHDGSEYISLTATVISNIKGVDNEYTISFYTGRLTRDGKESKLYDTYAKADSYIGKKVEITGELRENRYWSKSASQLVSFQQLAGRWINCVADSVTDEGTFVIGGFLAKSLVERTNKSNEIYRYDVTIGQSNYNGNGMSLYTLHIAPDNRAVVAGVEGYELGATVQLSGDLNFISEEREVEDTNAGFGQKLVHTYINRQRNFFVTGGSNPIEDDSTYNAQDRETLIAAYKDNDVKLSVAAKDSMVSTGSTNLDNGTVATPKVSKRQTSLI